MREFGHVVDVWQVTVVVERFGRVEWRTRKDVAGSSSLELRTKGRVVIRAVGRTIGDSYARMRDLIGRNDGVLPDRCVLNPPALQH